MLGGLLTQYLDWRAVFLINVPLAAITIVLTLLYTPPLRPRPGTSQALDFPGLLTFAVGISSLTLGLGQSQQWGWISPATLISLGLGIVGLVAFVLIEPRRRSPLMKFGLLRHLNFSAAVISQLLAGSIELATAYLLPFYLLLVIGLAPGPAGLALIPATVPIIIMAPLAGRWFDRVGGRIPLVAGFVVLAMSSFALVVAFPFQSLWPLIPGFLLQGVGLGIVLTVNDPTALGSVPAEDQGQASGVNDTGEQLGGAVGIALFSAILVNLYYGRFFGLLAERGYHPTQSQMDRGREFVLRAEQKGLRNIKPPPFMRDAIRDFEAAHVYAYQLTFALMGLVAIVGAVVCWLMVRKADHEVSANIFTRRSRWIWSTTGQGPGVTRKPPPERHTE